MGGLKKGWGWLAIYLVAALVFALAAVIVAWGAVAWVAKDEPEPTISRPSIVTFSHPTGSLTCGLTENAIDCTPTWLLVPPWETAEKSKALYELGDTDGH